MQVARQVVKLNPSDLCLPARAWKVKLLGEGADDAGGVFDDTITEMCQVIHINTTAALSANSTLTAEKFLFNLFEFFCLQ